MLQINRTDDGFELSHAELPAPLVITHAAGREFAKALASPDLRVAAWKTDKLVWADPDRAPIGVWVTQAGQPQIWVMGKTIDVTADEAAEIGLSILKDVATHQVGTEVQNEVSLNIYDEASGDRVTTLPTNTLFVVTGIKVGSGGDIIYVLEAPSNPGLFTRDVLDQHIRVADPLTDWSVSQTGYLYSDRFTTVSARTAREAQDLAVEHFKQIGNKVGWATNGSWEVNGIDTIERIEGTKEDLAYAEGWVYGPKKTIVARVDTDNNRVFADDDAAFDFVLEKALAGSRRHADAIRAFHNVGDADQ